MSIVGFDFGSRNCTIAVIRNRKLEIATNEVSMRYTPNVVGFTFKKREVGEAGKVQFLRNAQNSVYGTKLLLGRKFQDPDLQKILPKLGAGRWTELENGDVGLTASYAGDTTVFTAEQLTACMLTNLKYTTEAFTLAPMSNCVVSVPGWWSHRQRRAMLNACSIAEIVPLRLVNDLSAVAFNYGFYHPNDFNEKSQKVMFVSLGHTGFQCNVVEFSKPCCTVKATAYDLTIGASLIDEILATHFAQRFHKKTGSNLQQNKRAMLKLLLATEATKKTLNTNPFASINQDCIFDGLDLQDSITKDEYIEMLNTYNIPQRVVQCVKGCLESAKIQASELLAIEWVGSGMRVQAIRDALETFFGRPLSATMNAEEAVAMGCALLCARLSPTASTRPYDLVELNKNNIIIDWNSDGPDRKRHSLVLYPAGFALPSTKVRTSTFNRQTSDPFEVQLCYPNDTAHVLQGSHTIALAKVSGIPKRNSDLTIKMKFRADPSGTVSVVQTDMIEEKEETVEVPIPMEEEKKEGEGEKAGTEGEKKDGEAMETEEKKPKTRTEVRKVDASTKLTTEVLSDELTAQKVAQFKTFEQSMRATEAAVVAALTAKNDLETFVYFVREKIDGAWKEFGTSRELSSLGDILDGTSAWLYGDGDDVTKDEYLTKKSAITNISNKLDSRHKEWNSVPVALDELNKAVGYFKAEAQSGDEKYSHIAPEEMSKILTQCSDAERVVGEKLGALQRLSKTDDPVLFSSDLIQRKENLITICTRILNTPKPKPPPPAKEETPEAPAAASPQSASKMEEEGQQPTGEPAKKEGMETDVD
eukprot:TRINITY_DN771_c0_g1_i1.p1 TRINITY_DN771_c0_g1~~TRINITY_DN771_c0_g1_i1.p1  ORF type:complete len:814 (+),score=223.09 TRINITY_DN771_c0_g1_i1:88-2529(+)